MMHDDILLRVVMAALPAVVAITFHEAAHGYAALALGDETARRQGRLSLNPLRHIDPVGTLLLPGLLLIGQLLTFGHVQFMFGWANPVPVALENLRRPKRDMALVASAGPAMNVMLAWVSALLLHIVSWKLARDVLQYSILENLALALFNLLPIPPLDGGRIAVGLLPLRLAVQWARFEKTGILVVMIAVYLLPPALRHLGYDIDPVGWLLGSMMNIAVRVVCRLAGLDAGS